MKKDDRAKPIDGPRRLTMLRWILGGIVAVGVGIFFLVRYFADLPTLEQLTTVSGDVVNAEVKTQRTRRTRSEYLAVQIGSHPTVFYRDRFPDFEKIVGTIKQGDRVTAWVDAGDSNIWQLERGGERLVSYEQIAEAEKSNNRMNGLLGAVFVVVGLGTVGVMGWRWKTGATAGG
jgi:hypothetical protein